MKPQAFLLFCGLLAMAIAAHAEPASTALVTTAPVQQGSIPRMVTAYGTVMAASGATTTLSLAAPGIVERINVVVGDAVRQGETVAEITADPATMSSYIQAKSTLKTAIANRAHVQALLHGRLATVVQLDQADQAVQSAQARLDALRREGAGKATLRITAPFDAVVTAVPAAQGPVLPAGTPLATLIHSANLVALVGLDPAELAKVRVGDPVEATGADSGGRHEQDGKVVRLAAMVDPTSGLVNATIALPAGKFMAGEVIKAEINVGAAHGVMVPRDAALPAGRNAILYQAVKGHARAITVHILGSAQNHSIVAGPIDPQYPIIVAGNYQLENGMAIREAPAADPKAPDSSAR
jgi:membrane fusion protein (multidrug efflux system)